MSIVKAERRIYGINACQSFFQRYPAHILRAWLSPDAARLHFGPLMKYLAQEKRAYHLADAGELERVTESSHHEGVCLLIEDWPVFTPEAWLATQKPGRPLCLLALDGVSNPHNLGAIMRVAAHFGVNAILSENPQALRSGAAIRTAEGGATHLSVVGTDHLVKTLNLLKKSGFTVLATSSHDSAPLYADALPSRLVLVLGEEQKGVSGRVLQVADGRIAIDGTGWVESLNVSVATGVLLGEFWRQHRRAATAPAAARPRPQTPQRPAARPDSPQSRRPRPPGGKPRPGKPRQGKPGQGKRRPG